MNGFVPLALALKRHFKKSFANLPAPIQARVTKDFSPWPWDKMEPDERRDHAKRRDFENDPATYEALEGLKAITDPSSPSYSEQATQRLRGDFLPEPKISMTNRKNLAPLTWVDQPAYQLVPTSQLTKIFTSSPQLSGSTRSQKQHDRTTQPETSVERNRRRFQMCIDAGLEMPSNDYGRLPSGINKLAENEGISTAGFSKSIKAHLASLHQ